MFAVIIIGSLSFSVLMSIGWRKDWFINRRNPTSRGSYCSLEGLKTQFTTISNAISWSLFIARSFLVICLSVVFGYCWAITYGCSGCCYSLAVLFQEKVIHVFYMRLVLLVKRKVSRKQTQSTETKSASNLGYFVRDLKNVMRSTTYLFNVLFAPLIALSYDSSMVISFVAMVILIWMLVMHLLF